jgi:methyl-accepting chemotaxis protein
MFITNSITKPIHVGIELANRIAEGDLTQSLDIEEKMRLDCWPNATVNENLRSIVQHLSQYSEQIADQVKSF